jgi:hypothetical protein
MFETYASREEIDENRRLESEAEAPVLEKVRVQIGKDIVIARSTPQ